MPKIVLDTSVIINGLFVAHMESGNIRNSEVIIPQAVVDELQSQASQKKDQGFTGLNEIKNLKNLSKNFGLEIKIEGNHPSLDDIRLSGKGKIDAIIKDIAKEKQATLYTSDNVQHLVAQTEDITSVYLRPEIKEEELEFLKYFDSETMSVHLKENLTPLAKKGKPGSFALTKISDELLTRDDLEFMAKQILDTPKTSESSTIEISKTGASVIQYKDYRIAITKPPFSESFEITIVHPIVKLTLDDYSISPELMERFTDRAEGIVISGPPGSGKSTLASGLANFYHNQGKIVKTFESPRDLQVDAGITQYSKLDGSFDNTADILLLVRPDYTVFDEVRRREDFLTFSDLRLTGVGMVGVVHANSPLDAIQRFIGKIELGIIPNVLDTVVFVKDGQIEKVYDLELKVKVPTGMTESDLARPVIEIRNFENNKLEHEIYTFGEENVIVPIGQKTKKVGIEKLAEDKIRETFKRYDPRAEVEVLSDNRVKVMVDKQSIPAIIGRGGSNINDIEKSLNIHIDVVERDSSSNSMSGDLPFSFSESKTSIVLEVSREYTSMHADIFVNDKYVTTSRIGKKGQIKIPRRSDAARNLMELATSQNDIRIYLKDF
ncbi:MAG: PINc/VapC family ATPase [Nitrosopumilus sp.]|uniref:Flp pilus assembly complex ATPase component TadA n=2 Tax=Candidatus Nitrosomaritimum aestuariumsis TaxID=3342354 RepID=A0AC60WB59_9ARCH|nr:Flp pilus assembly complex ATPase component TadA [Nitrosopumilaceae archaeon]MBA4459423.1 Flp pilus assembly complex ATPase component TadA [Nitrosopumilaceae archaeon]MBA4462338.1 Flp pilus assembly complex ATPase component TadA [Nitrosopumilaceae archaeon]MBA4464279.1 Flp pilus assembly complex ATPase component TadA [Nitrosopumilaceae archaeon]NCF22078.1 ATPase [Nitrosopumilaceae archaeon]